MTLVIDSNRFQNAWANGVHEIMMHGINRPADDKRAVLIRHAPMVVDLNAEALADVAAHRLHTQYPQQHGIEEYIAQFDPESPQAQRSVIDQPYTYLSRSYRQVRYIDDNNLLAKEFNKRVQFTTWSPFEDLGSPAPPCMNMINLVNIGGGRIHATAYWRSHDFGSAWQWNIIALYEYINRELLKPHGYTLVHYTEFNASAHIYEYDWLWADKVRPMSNVELHFNL